MEKRQMTCAQVWAILLFCSIAILSPIKAAAAPYAAMVIDARSGEVLHATNADARLHPASLTKMMTLYIVFEAVTNGEITMDTKVTISRNAAMTPYALGFRAGQEIALRYIVRAAAVRSSNDGATALAEAISGSVTAFAKRMNATAKALGMTNTTFKNPHGLTAQGHLSSARDMTTLGRHLFFDYPQYYNLFSRQTADAHIRTVSTTNALLSTYRGADGIKTGFTSAAGFNLVASAERGGERIIATVFGGRSSASRNAKVAELLDLGFARAPSRVAIRKPVKPAYGGPGAAFGVATLTRSRRPVPRPSAAERQIAIAIAAKAPQVSRAVTETLALAAVPSPAPRPTEPELEVVMRASTSGGRHWGINIGRYGSRYTAQRVLLQTALVELGTLDEALRKVVRRPGGFDANFVGMTRERAHLACRRLSARDMDCETLGPG